MTAKPIYRPYGFKGLKGHDGTVLKRMYTEGELKGKPVNPHSPGRIASKTSCVLVYVLCAAFVA